MTWLCSQSLSTMCSSFAPCHFGWLDYFKEDEGKITIQRMKVCNEAKRELISSYKLIGVI